MPLRPPPRPVDSRGEVQRQDAQRRAPSPTARAVPRGETGRPAPRNRSSAEARERPSRRNRIAAQRPHVQKSRNELSLKTLATIEPISGLAMTSRHPSHAVSSPKASRAAGRAESPAARCNRRPAQPPLLPGNRPIAANQPMSRNNPQGMKRMIDRTNQAVLPVSSLDLFCLANVPRPVGKTGLGVPERPGHQTSRHRHQETDPDCVLKRRHDGHSTRARISRARDPSLTSAGFPRETTVSGSWRDPQ